MRLNCCYETRQQYPNERQQENIETDVLIIWVFRFGTSEGLSAYVQSSRLQQVTNEQTIEQKENNGKIIQFITMMMILQ